MGESEEWTKSLTWATSAFVSPIVVVVADVQMAGVDTPESIAVAHERGLADS